MCVRKEAWWGLQPRHTDTLAAHLISPSLITTDGLVSLSVLMLAVAPLIPPFNHRGKATQGPQLALGPLEIDPCPPSIRRRPYPQFCGQMWDMSQSAPRDVCRLRLLCQHQALCVAHNERQSSLVCRRVHIETENSIQCRFKPVDVKGDCLMLYWLLPFVVRRPGCFQPSQFCSETSTC